MNTEKSEQSKKSQDQPLRVEQELLNTQLNVEGISNKENSNYELVSTEAIEGTPFHVVGEEEKGYFISLGRYRVSEVQKTKDEALEELYKNMWYIIMNVIITTVDILKENEGNG